MAALPEPRFNNQSAGFPPQSVRLSGILAQSIVDGPGLRLVVFTQGCPHRCEGCHNPATHSFRSGFYQSTEFLLEAFDANPILSGITLSGGEPLAQAAALAPLAEGVKARGKNVWCYTGYTFEEALELAGEDSALRRLLGNVDVLVDGRFDLAQKSASLLYRGSANQRILDVPASLELRTAVTL